MNKTILLKKQPVKYWKKYMAVQFEPPIAEALTNPITKYIMEAFVEALEKLDELPH